MGSSFFIGFTPSQIVEKGKAFSDEGLRPAAALIVAKYAMFRFRQGENCTRFLAPPLPEQTACAGFARGKGNGRFARLQAELCFRPRTCRGRKRIAFFRAYGRELCEASCKHILGQKKGPPQTDLVQGEPDKSPRYHLNFPCGTLVASVTGGPAIPYWPFGNGAPGPPSPPPPRRLAPTGVSLCRRRAGTPSHPSLFTLTVYAKAGDLSRAVPGFAPEGAWGAAPSAPPGFARGATYFCPRKKPKLFVRVKVGKEPPGVGRGWLSAQRAGLGQSACTPGPPRRRKVRLVSFPPAAKTAPASLLLLSPQNPLRWAFAGAP